MATQGMSPDILDFGGTCPCWLAVLTSATVIDSFPQQQLGVFSESEMQVLTRVVDVSEVLFKVVNNLCRELICCSFHFGKHWPVG